MSYEFQSRQPDDSSRLIIGYTPEQEQHEPLAALYRHDVHTLLRDTARQYEELPYHMPNISTEVSSMAIANDIRLDTSVAGLREKPSLILPRGGRFEITLINSDHHNDTANFAYKRTPNSPPLLSFAQQNIPGGEIVWEVTREETPVAYVGASIICRLLNEISYQNDVLPSHAGMDRPIITPRDLNEHITTIARCGQFESIENKTIIPKVCILSDMPSTFDITLSHAANARTREERIELRIDEPPLTHDGTYLSKTTTFSTLLSPDKSFPTVTTSVSLQGPESARYTHLIESDPAVYLEILKDIHKLIVDRTNDLN